VFPFWVFSALLVLWQIFIPSFGFRRALYVAWVCFAWFYFMLELFFFFFGEKKDAAQEARIIGYRANTGAVCDAQAYLGIPSAGKSLVPSFL
jgi:hypothetical protein